jgi:hypothetical protein
MDDDALEAALVDQIESVLSDGPFALDDLTELLAEGGYLDAWDADDFDDLVAIVREILYAHDDFWLAPGEVVAHAPSLLAETVFTHRATADELDRGMLDLAVDLLPVTTDAVGPIALAGGGVLDTGFAETDEGARAEGSYIGPDGWLSGFAPGEVIALRRTDDGVVVERVDVVGAGDLEVAELSRAYDARVPDRDVGAGIDELVLDAITARPAVFTRPVRPLGELLADAGLEVRGDWVGPLGGDWQVPRISAAEAAREVLIARYQLDTCCLDHLDLVMDAWNSLVLPREDVDIDWPRVAASLRHGLVAPAFADHVLPADEPSALLADFTNTLREADPRATAPAMFLVARNLERGGDALAAETALLAAVRADPEFDAALDELAWYAADRGDVDQAVNLLRRSGVSADDPELALLESMRPKRNAVGRNEPCPCGSGRKFKDCCLRNPVIPIERRADWLHHKLWTYVLRPGRQEIALSLGLVLAHDEDDVDELLDLGLPMDLAAFEAELAQQFLAERGDLLPAEERAMLTDWIAQPRRLWEVVRHDEPAGVLHLRDVDTGREVAVVTGSDSMEPGDLIYARVGGLGDRHRFVGVPIDIEPDGREAAAALVASKPNAFAVAQWFWEMTAPLGEN